MKTVIPVLLLLSLFFCSCSKSEHKESIKKLDSLETVLSGLKEEVNKLESDSSKGIYNTVKKEIDFIGKNLAGLPKNQEKNLALDKYANHSKGLKRVYKNLSVYLKDIDYSQNQINNLRSDIKKGVLKKQEIEQFVSDEETAVILLEVKIKDDQDKFNKIKLDIENLQPIITQISDSLRKSIKTP